MAAFETILDPNKSFDIHLGLTDTYAEMFQSHMESQGFEVHRAGDGWETWGEDPNKNGNDENTAHVVLRVKNIEEAIMSAFEQARKYRDILVPTSRQNALDLNEIIIVVTEGKNWDVRFVDIYQNEYKTQTAQFRASKAIVMP